VADSVGIDGEARATLLLTMVEEQATMVRPRVLIVDDDPKVLSLMVRGLAFEGYAVDVASDGTAAPVESSGS
jgi:hypothetical protein